MKRTAIKQIELKALDKLVDRLIQENAMLKKMQWQDRMSRIEIERKYNDLLERSLFVQNELTELKKSKEFRS